MDKKVVLVDYGLANSFKEHIEINEELKDYPELYEYVLKHERSHSDENFSLNDFKKEFGFNKNIFKLSLFVLKRPKLWKEFLPYYKRNGERIIDLNMIGMYCLAAILICLNVLIFSKIF